MPVIDKCDVQYFSLFPFRSIADNERSYCSLRTRNFHLIAEAHGFSAHRDLDASLTRRALRSVRRESCEINAKTTKLARDEPGRLARPGPRKPRTRLRPPTNRRDAHIRTSQ